MVLSAEFLELHLSFNGINLLKEFLNPDPDPNDFRTLMVISLSNDTSMVKFS